MILLINLLITLLIIVLVGYVIRWGMQQLAVPVNIQNLVMVILALIALLWVLQGLIVIGGPPWPRLVR